MHPGKKFMYMKKGQTGHEKLFKRLIDSNVEVINLQYLVNGID